MRRIYYSSNFFRPTNISCFRYLRILSFSYYSVIKVQLHCLTSERCHRSFQEHRSLFNTILFFETKRPGTHRRVARATYLLAVSSLYFYVCVPFNKFTITPIITYYISNSVEMAGFEPATFALQRRCSPTELHPQDLLGRVGLTGFEPVTPALSAQCSNQLSYKPGWYFNN